MPESNCWVLSIDPDSKSLNKGVSISAPLTKSDEKGSSCGLQTVTAQAVTTNYFGVSHLTQGNQTMSPQPCC
jgi:hypothetical protein